MPPTDDDHVSERFPQVPSSIQSQTRVRQQLYNIVCIMEKQVIFLLLKTAFHLFQLKPFGALFRQKYEMMRLRLTFTLFCLIPCSLF